MTAAIFNGVRKRDPFLLYILIIPLPKLPVWKLKILPWCYQKHPHFKPPWLFRRLTTTSFYWRWRGEALASAPSFFILIIFLNSNIPFFPRSSYLRVLSFSILILLSPFCCFHIFRVSYFVTLFKKLLLKMHIAIKFNPQMITFICYYAT